MTGVSKAPTRQKEGVKGAYEAQRRIGWEHFRKGRLSRAWGSKEIRGESELSATEYVTGMAAIMIEWLGDKWRLRCEIVSAPEKTLEKLTTYGRCMSMWRRRSEITVMREDRGLFEERHAPRESQTLDYLRAWLATRELAIKEYDNYDPSRKQSKIDKWLRPRPGAGGG